MLDRVLHCVAIFLGSCTLALSIEHSIRESEHIILYDGCVKHPAVSGHGLRKEHLYLRRVFEKPDVALEVTGQ